MNGYYTHTIEETPYLNELYGASGGNIACIEKILGEKIITQGNQLIFASENQAKQASFKCLIDALLSALKKGQPIDNALIEALADTILQQQEPPDFYAKITLNSETSVFAKSQNQSLYIKSMQENDLVFGLGPAGTGKTFLAVACALSEVLQKKRKKIVLTRPVVETGESLGYLPGDLSQKIEPYLRPLYDSIEALIPAQTLKRLQENNQIEALPLAYMRGRSLKDAIIILDEGQNATKEQMKMFLTRLSIGSRLVITADITQIDLAKKREAGILQAIRILNSLQGIGFCRFEEKDVVRHPLIKKIIKAYEVDEVSGNEQIR